VIDFDPDRTAAPPAYLAPDPARVESWWRRLEGLGDSSRLRVGLSWQGDPKFPADACRSIPLAALEPLLALKSVAFFSLQKGPASRQLKKSSLGNRMVDFGDELDTSGAFLDTAAIIQSLDLVITSDTAVAHLAGALGVPVWVALADVPDWRWQLGRSDSPWYPSARLFRQPLAGDWPTVVAEIMVNLAAEQEVLIGRRLKSKT